MLAILKSEGGYVSGEKISGALGVSRAAVNAAIKSLRDEGYEINSSTNRGYELAAGPNILTSGELLCRLGEARMERVVCLDTVDSTNTHLRLLAQNGAPEGQIVVSNCQTGGRGRLGRPFLSPPDVGVYMSVLLRPEGSPAETANITAWTAEAVCGAVEAACGIRPGIKWVNDLILDRRKTAGILTEMSVESESGSVQYVVIGVGVNVNQQEADFPPELRNIAGSLRMASGGEVSRADLAAEMVRSFDALIMDFPNEREGCLAVYRRDCLTPGNRVLIRRGDTEREAFAEGIGDDFGLVVRYDDGVTETLSSGEVSVRGLLGYV